MPTSPLCRRTVVRLALLGLAGMPFAALAPFAAVAQESAAAAPIQRLYGAMLGVMKAGPGVPFEQRLARLAPTIDAVFDLAGILATSVGPSWSTISADQRSALTAAFRRYTVASYVNNFSQYTGQRFEVSPTTRALPNNDQVVTSNIIPASGDPHRLDFVMRQINGDWRVVDVLADGTISRVAVQRSDFRHLLLQGGSAALVASLQSKADELASG